MTTETMTDLTTAEEAKKLAEDCRLAAKVLADTHTFPTGQAVLAEAARTVIALHAQLADAQAAQAMVVERAAAKADRGHGTYCRARGRDPEKYVSAFYLMAREIRDLAPIDGLALVRELRAEIETRHQLHLEQVRITNEWIAERDRLAAANAALEAKVAGLRRDALILLAQIDGVEDATGEAPEGEDALLVAEIRTALAKSRVACMAAEADRDRLAAANAALEAKVAGLAEALKKADTALSDEGYRETQWPRPQIRAALATQEAGNAQSTPPISPEEAQFNAVRHHERFGPLDEKGNPLDPRRRG